MCVKDARGTVIKRGILPTTKKHLIEAVKGVRAPRTLTFEEGTLAAWAHALLAERVTRLIVCDPAQNRLLMAGSKSDASDAERLCELLRLGALHPVFHGDAKAEHLRMLANHYDAVTTDVIRLKLRLRASFRSAAVSTTGSAFFNSRHRRRYLKALRRHPSQAARAEMLFRQLDAIEPFAAEARTALLEEAATHPAFIVLRSLPYIGEVRAAILIATIVTPTRFPNVRKFWAYAGFAVRRRASAEHSLVQGRPVRKEAKIGGAIQSKYCRPLRRVLLDAGRDASNGRGPLRVVFDRWIARGLPRRAAQRAMSRKIATLVLTLWQSMTPFDPVLFKISSGRPVEHQLGT